LLVIALAGAADKQADKPADKKPSDPMSEKTFSGLKLRSIGPAVTSGRIVGFAVEPGNRGHYYVASAAGGVWKTTNNGTSWTPIFDDQGSSSIGCVALDPKNPNTVWVGAGENNSQRSVGYGDGVYRSDDGGKTWQNVGLKKSEHIGKILIDPRHSNVVYVAAQGPLWGPGGDRGLYKTTDGGKNWKKVLNISENTGVTDVVFDPQNPDVLLAAAYQRRRHVWTLINGGPESAIYRSSDGGASWNKIKTGLPTEEMGRIGFAIAPSSPHMVYAIIESIEKKGGIFRSTDFGVTWEKRNDWDQQAQYYAHIVVDPKNSDRLYAMNVYIQVSDDGAKTLRKLGEKWKHVDNHEIWIDPNDTDFYRVGCDGGIYESNDRASSWRFVANLPVTQFYDVAAGNDGAFYHVYGGTQDNFTLGGPARNKSVNGIGNADWYVTQGGDGFHCRVDPQDANTIYSESQYAGLVRYDRKTGESLGITPQPGKGEESFRWNWDSPLIVSPHQHTRIYFAANKVFRSDDRGDTWKEISGDLTRRIDRNKLKVMGKIWPADAVSKSVSTSLYGNIVALSESPKKEGLLYAGTDDGLIQVTEDGGQNWRKIDKFPGVPDQTYVSRILTSQHDENMVYATFDNHKRADFAPYVLKSTDAGKTWTAIKGGLPENGPCLAIAEDHVDPNLLFLGTEFGLFFTTDGGQHWIRLKGGMPTVAVRDLAIQKQQNDLVVGTFGRGIYILDDYSLLRGMNKNILAQEAVTFQPRKALSYIETRQYGLDKKSFQGEGFYIAANPPFGATFTYYLKDDIKTLREQRHEAEKKAAEKGEVPYPTHDQLRAEAEEEPPTVLLAISDATGHTVRTITGPVKGGLHRASWDLREPSAALPKPRPKDSDDDLFYEEPVGPLVLPGRYRVTMMKRVRGLATPLAQPQEFAVETEGTSDMNPTDRKILAEFQQQVNRLQRAVAGALDAANHLHTRLEEIKRALDHTPTVEAKLKDDARSLEKRNRDILRALRGDVAIRARNENTPISIVERVENIVGSQRLSLAPPNQTQRTQYRIAADEFSGELAKLRTLVDVDLKALEKALDRAGAPWTPGRLPEWNEKIGSGKP
jgi:photosystem II stability/assembly factor-like uncharacterized protein